MTTVLERWRVYVQARPMDEAGSEVPEGQ